MEVLTQLAHRGQPFTQFDLALFERPYLSLIGPHQGIAVGFNDPVEELRDTSFGLAQLCFDSVSLTRREPQPQVPNLAERLARHREQRLARAKIEQQLFELVFHHVSADGFAVVRAALGEAQIVGVVLRPALGEHALEGLLALAADDVTAQGKILAEVLTRRHLRLAGQALLNPLIGGEADDRLVLAGDQ